MPIELAGPVRELPPEDEFGNKEPKKTEYPDQCPSCGAYSGGSDSCPNCEQPIPPLEQFPEQGK